MAAGGIPGFARRPRVAVVGHVEWVTHTLGPMPGAGDITHLTDPVQEPGGGGAVAAVQVARLGADTLFLTAVGDDDLGRRTVEAVRAHGVEVRAAVRRAPQTTVLSTAYPGGDRAIAVVGERLHPQPGDDLGWDDLADMDAVYFTGRDPGTLPACRRAPLLAVMGRRWRVLADSAVPADILVGSGADPSEHAPPDAFASPPGLDVRTDGSRGGTYRHRDGGTGGWEAVPPPGPVIDTYGCGDSFAAGLVTALAAGRALPAALELAAACGAWCATGRGTAVQLTAAGL